jgi:hypothetical protein
MNLPPYHHRLPDVLLNQKLSSLPELFKKIRKIPLVSCDKKHNKFLHIRGKSIYYLWVLFMEGIVHCSADRKVRDSLPISGKMDFFKRIVGIFQKRTTIQFAPSFLDEPQAL